MLVGITGASGYLGTVLRAELARHDHRVVSFVRRAPGAADEREWDGRTLDPAKLAGLDAVVHLSGAGVGDKRWSPAYRAQLRSSRIETTTAVANAVAEAGTPVLLSGNAIGWYGDRGTERLDETSTPGKGFLADLCVEWEAAVAPATARARVAVLRTGVVLGKDDAMLRKQVPLFKAFLGAPLGSGKQYLSWIALADWSAAVRHLLTSEVSGPVNLTSPQPVTNREFTKALGKALHRPTLPIAVPGFVLRAVLGGLAGEALGSQRVLPSVLSGSGFDFTHPDLPSALAAALA